MKEERRRSPTLWASSPPAPRPTTRAALSPTGSWSTAARPAATRVHLSHSRRGRRRGV